MVEAEHSRDALVIEKRCTVFQFHCPLITGALDQIHGEIETRRSILDHIRACLQCAKAVRSRGGPNESEYDLEDRMITHASHGIQCFDQLHERNVSVAKGLDCD